MLRIETLINNPIPSNCYVLFLQNHPKCIIVDPGSENTWMIEDFLLNNHLSPDYIILTHEHFDHIWSVNRLKNIFLSKVVCSKICSEAIIDPKKNMSVFYKHPGFSLREPDIIIDKNNKSLNWENYQISFYHTPGHTDGSICFMIGDYLFTGDTLIKDEETVTKLPGGSKQKLEESINLLNAIANCKTLIMSGHGDSFQYKKPL